MILFDSIQAVAITLVCYLLLFSLFYAVRYLKKSNENKIKKYTIEFCVNDNKDYSAISANIFSKDLNKLKFPTFFRKNQQRQPLSKSRKCKNFSMLLFLSVF